MNKFNNSSIESLGPTQELGPRGGFEAISNHYLCHLLYHYRFLENA
jgi:hypothetical protein